MTKNELPEVRNLELPAKRNIKNPIRIIAFYGTEQCACIILVISIFQNISYDQFEILYIFSLKK